MGWINYYSFDQKWIKHVNNFYFSLEQNESEQGIWYHVSYEADDLIKCFIFQMV